jgi:hypothetical protein
MRTRVRIAGVTTGLLAVLAAGAVHVATRDPVTSAAAAPGPRPRIPLEIARDSLNAQAAGLLAGDEKRWLAGVDPAQPELRARYRTMYASLRGLGVTAFAYDVLSADVRQLDPARFRLVAHVRYCLRGNTCTEPEKNPRLDQDLVLRPAGGRYVVTALTRSGPLPWADGGKLIFATGERVTVAGPPGERRRLRRVLELAEKSAIVADRFAALLGTRPPRYRVYLAGPKQWRSWYGGGQRGTTVGYAIALRETGTDVVLDMNRLADDESLLSHTIQHELGHAVTIGGAVASARASGDMWMREGIAEYIGWYPQTALASWRRPAVHRSVLSGRRPASIAVAAMAGDAGRDESNTYYGFAHFAADCLAREYGERPLLVFADEYLRQGKDLDVAARKAFGRPFATVDRACVAWIRLNA